MDTPSEKSVLHATFQGVNGRPPRILVVDDDDDHLEMMSLLLTMEECGVVAIQDPATALERARSEHFDLLVCDLRMPNTNGFDFADEFQKIETQQGTPVLFISANRELPASDHPRSYPFDFLYKGYAGTRMLPKIAQLIGCRA